MKLSLATLILSGCMLLQSCTSLPFAGKLPSELAEHMPQQHVIADVAFFPQDEYLCGPAALAGLLESAGIATTPDDLLGLVYLPDRHGSLQPEMFAAPRAFGMVSHTVNGGLEGILNEIDQGNLVLVMQNLGLSFYPQWHYAVVKGYDLERRKIILNSGTIEDYALSLRTFTNTWNRAGQWAMTVTAPGRIPVTATPASYLQASLPLLASDNQTAVTLLQAGLDQWPGDRSLMMAMGNHLYEQGLFEPARIWFHKTVTAYPDYAFAWNNLAYATLAAGDPAAAFSAVTEARRLAGPDDSEISASYREISASLASVAH